MEELSKTQIVLLTLLVSFVTSIATGIVTVSLLDQAPPEVQQTVNKVVERTVERVVPREGQGASTGTVVKEVTKVVNENDLVTDSIQKNSTSLVRIFRHPVDAATTTETATFAGIGFIVSENGLVATDDSTFSAGGQFTAVVANGSRRTISVAFETDTSPITLGKLVQPTDRTYAAITFGGSNALKLGQSVVALSGRQTTNVATGVISELVMRTEEVPVENTKEAEEENTDEPQTKTVERLDHISTNIDGRTVLPGSPLISIFGEVLGIATHTTLSGQTAAYAPATDVRQLIAKYNQAQQSEAQEASETEAEGASASAQ